MDNILLTIAWTLVGAQIATMLCEIQTGQKWLLKGYTKWAPIVVLPLCMLSMFMGA